MASPSQHERDLLSRLTPDDVCQMIDSVFNELVGEFKVHGRAATTAEKLKGTKVWVPIPGRLPPYRASGGCGRGSPPRAVGVRVSLPENI